MYLTFLTSLTPSVEKSLNPLGFIKFINQEILIYYVVSVDHNCMAVCHTRSDCEGFLRSAVCPVHWNVMEWQ